MLKKYLMIIGGGFLLGLIMSSLFPASIDHVVALVHDFEDRYLPELPRALVLVIGTPVALGFVGKALGMRKLAMASVAVIDLVFEVMFIGLCVLVGCVTGVYTWLLLLDLALGTTPETEHVVVVSLVAVSGLVVAAFRKLFEPRLIIKS